MGLEGSNSPQSPPIPDCQWRSGCEGSSRAREEGEAGRSGGGVAGRRPEVRRPGCAWRGGKERTGEIDLNLQLVFH